VVDGALPVNWHPDGKQGASCTPLDPLLRVISLISTVPTCGGATIGQ
jgi:hypothetical protein